MRVIIVYLFWIIKNKERENKIDNYIREHLNTPIFIHCCLSNSCPPNTNVSLICSSIAYGNSKQDYSSKGVSCKHPEIWLDLVWVNHCHLHILALKRKEKHGMCNSNDTYQMLIERQRCTQFTKCINDIKSIG